MVGARPRYLLASAALHAALLLSALIAWPFMSRPMKMAEATPVTLVTQGPVDLSTATKALQPQKAAAPEPEPAAKPPPPQAAAEPAPEPPPPPHKISPLTPAKPAPPPVTIPKPVVKSSPAQQPSQKSPQTPALKPPPRPPPKPESLDLDQLASAAPTSHARTGGLDLGALAAADPKSARARPTPSAQTRGAARPETDLLARLAAGRATGLSADALSALQAKLNRLWNPNCEVEGGGGVIVKVGLKLSPDGRLLGQPALVSQAATGASQAVVDASAGRALSAVRQGEPYTEIPKDGPHDLVLRFDAKTACRR